MAATPRPRALPLLPAPPVLLLLLAAAGPAPAQADEIVPAQCDGHEDEALEVSLLQASARLAAGPGLANAAREHHWAHARGNPGSYSSTPHSMPANLSAAHAWSWSPPEGSASFLWATLIDAEKNLYVGSFQGIFKFSPDGHQLWHNPQSTLSPTLMGDALYGMSEAALAFKVDLRTGATVWSGQAAPDKGATGDFVEAHDGVMVVPLVLDKAALGVGGGPSVMVAGLDAANGQQLWDFKPDCGLWNMMALFPLDGTTVFMDQCGGVYRLGLHNGTVIWRQPGPDSYTDGGPIMGPDGSIYTCSSPPGTHGLQGETGLLSKFALHDGARLWQVETPYPCVNFPGVSRDGATVVVAPGGLAGPPKTGDAMGRSEREVRAAYRLEEELGQQQRTHYNLPNISAAIMGFRASDGAVLWRHEVPPWGKIAFAGDEERAFNHALGRTWLGFCWPSHWSGPVIGDDGTVYIGRSTGEFYVFHPERGETAFHHGDGVLMGGPAFAPDLMAFSSCSRLHVFRKPAA